MNIKLLNIGFGNYLVMSKVVGIFSPDSAPMKRLREEYRKSDNLIDVTHGRRTRAVILTSSNHVVLSSIQTETIEQRIKSAQH